LLFQGQISYPVGETSADEQAVRDWISSGTRERLTDRALHRPSPCQSVDDRLAKLPQTMSLWRKGETCWFRPAVVRHSSILIRQRFGMKVPACDD
jgi:hypothetical protein